MKKFIIVAALAIAAFSYSNAQEVGVRFGATAGNANGAIDFVMPFKAGRLHANLGFSNSGVGIDALYDFLYGEIGSGFHYYVGAGAFTLLGSPFSLGIVAEGGIEYRFEGAPIVLGIDYRPAFQILETTGFVGDSFGFNVRYVF